MFDLILTGGRVVDGTGVQPFVADVAVLDGKIAAVGDLSEATAVEVLDVTGNVITPGFIDVHTHSDQAAFLPDEGEAARVASVLQGVTTEVIGNCGSTAFPVSDEFAEQMRKNVKADRGPTGRIFSTLAEYREVMADHTIPVNFAPLVGHGAIRAAAVGFGRVTPDDAQLARMQQMLEEALDHGAFGLSSGLVYAPGVYSQPEELYALGQVLARRGSLYTTHMRNEMETVMEAVDEGIEVGRRTGTPVQLSHIKVAGKVRWGSVDRILERMEQANQDGFDVAGDVYPYTAGSTRMRAILPPWVLEDGVDAMLERLKDPAVREQVAREYESGLPGWQNFVGAAGWGGIAIASAPTRPEIQGRSIAELADEAGVTGAQMVADLLVDLNAEVFIVLHMMSEDDVRTLIADDSMLIGSDAIPSLGNPHPRLAGTFARVLGAYVRDQGISDLATMVHRMTMMPAARFRIPDRGRVAEGMIADLAVFDPDRVIDVATYEDPLQPPGGMAHVFVGGRAVVHGGRLTDVRPGAV
ncbi:MAG: D-aminoacylase, partial [Nitriliruptoraceae bacterium]